MNLDDLGNLGEFLAAVAVVGSLVFVGIQMRLNTRELRLQRKFEANQEWSSFYQITGSIASILARKKTIVLTAR